MSKSETETITEVMKLCDKCETDKKNQCHHPCHAANAILNSNGFEYRGDKK